MYLILGEKAENDPSVLNHPKSEEETFLFAQIKKRIAATPGWFAKAKAAIRAFRKKRPPASCVSTRCKSAANCLSGDQRQ